MSRSAEPSEIAIIGAGIVGLTMAYRLSRLGRNVVVMDKENGPGLGVTAGQANVIHVIQLPFGSLKSRLARKGNVMYDDLCRELGVKLDRMPALLVVKSWLMVPVLLFAFAYLRIELGHRFRVRLMRGGKMREIEPLLAKRVVGGLAVDGYGTVDVQALVSRLREAAAANGTRFLFGCEVVSAAFQDGATTLQTTRGSVLSRLVINAAGLRSDEVARALGSDMGRLEPGLGVMAVYAELPVRSIVAPLPVGVSSRTKGGAIIPATDGTVIVGPTLRVAKSKEDRAYTAEDLELLETKFDPLLDKKGRLVRVYTGVRPLSPTGDFAVEFDRERRVVNLVGIESPGLTAAPAIAEMVERIIAEDYK